MKNDANDFITKGNHDAMVDYNAASTASMTKLGYCIEKEMKKICEMMILFRGQL